MTYEPQALESKWRERWATDGRYEADPDPDEEATFVTVPYPYPNGGMHIGHARTYTVPDVWARYRRLQGDNVLFPIAWHVTGTPIVGAVERLKEGETEQLSVLRDTYGVPEAELQDLETPMGFARYFIENHYKKNFQQLGLSIDWRREFTTNDDRYSRFITWQYETLKDRGLLEKGLHPVNYCTNEEQPVTTHDILEGENAEFQEFTLIRFRGTDGETVYPMATLRPETVRGVTNAFVDPDSEYVRATVDGEPTVLSAAAVEKFELQDHTVTVEDRFPGGALVGDRVTNPVTEEAVVILPASFVDPDNATGVVMSVPAHSPDDYIALQEVQARADEIAAEYGVSAEEVRAIEPVPILEIEGYGDIPAADAVAAAGIESSDDPDLPGVTEDLYQDEFHRGRLLDNYGEYAGEVIEEVRDRFRADHEARDNFGTMYEFTEEVICRCGGDVEVAQQDTWFLNYDDEDWKQLAHDAVAQLDAIPENTREQFDYAVDWLEKWPCIRNYGLGTRLPWDDAFVIEPLSDSTIYMAYYTIAPQIQDIPVEDLDHAFFDALFYGADAVEDPDERALALREEWQYWYPVDYRCSGNDLINNHLTFYLFHHAELFEPPEWPQGVTVMGMGLLEGEAMSSSKGHVVLPTEAIETYGADTVRFFLLNSAEPWQDYDWRSEEVASTREQLDRFWERASEVIAADAPDDRPELAHIDRWLLARLQSTIREATAALDRFETRRASQAVFYRFAETLRWYRRRTDLDRPGAKWTQQTVLATRLRLLAPFVPFLTNELHDRLVGTPAEDAAWPEPDPALEDQQVEAEEALVQELVEDINDIIDVTGTDPETVWVYTAADWKTDVFETVVDVGPEDTGAIMGAVMEDPANRERGDVVESLVSDLVETVRSRSDEEVAALTAVEEREVYERASTFLAETFDATVEVVPETAASDEKASQAVPFRPAIRLE
ncbi:MAG: leucine--tRNA ligase [Halobacteriaceae archaeon]